MLIMRPIHHSFASSVGILCLPLTPIGNRFWLQRSVGMLHSVKDMW